jgi:spore coat protein H
MKPFAKIISIFLFSMAAALNVQAAENLFYPHVVTTGVWETEICIINGSSEQGLTGTLKGYSDEGVSVTADISVDLAAFGRKQIVVSDEYTDSDDIGYMIFEITSGSATGYTKFWIDGNYRVAVPAVSSINSGDIYIPHIASSNEWWTGVSLLNTTSSDKELSIRFNDGTVLTHEIGASEHHAFTISSLFGGNTPDGLESAVIENGDGVIGLELFCSSGTTKYLSGILLGNETATSLYYSHIDTSGTWWTGIVAYNPSDSQAELTITPYQEDGTALTTQNLTIEENGKYIGVLADLNLPSETAWLAIEANQPVSGFELFGNNDGSQMVGYSVVDIAATQGLFPRIEQKGWTGIAFVNLADGEATVELSAYDDDGNLQDSSSIELNSHEKRVDVAESLFTSSIDDATYIRYASDQNVVGFQINGSNDSFLADALETLPSSGSPFINDADFEAADWTDETHSKKADPNITEVFDDTVVKRFDFVITEDRWQSMLDNMTELYGEFGQQSGAGLLDIDEDPIFVPAEVYYNGIQWYRVGIRFKGNSSLQSPWQQGILKLPFKLDFDEFEDDYPQIKNQRFYGFKKFSLKNNYNDKSQLREKVAADVFAKAGVPVSHTGFYTLYVDHGNGPEYFGLYTLVEEVDGTVLDTQFSSDDGNLYKPEEGGANFVDGTFDEEYFEKKTNEDEEDWSDILAMFAALHDDTYTTSPATWRANLESVFDVDGFLKYLAVNGIIQNWDTYGRMTHNYYLYNDPDTGKLTWIPWDNNEALKEGQGGGGGALPPDFPNNTGPQDDTQNGALALDFLNLDAESWPLIGKLYADETYKAQYNSYLLEVIESSFETTATQALYDYYSSLVGPYATTEIEGYSFLDRADDFYRAISELKVHAISRDMEVYSYLNAQ